MENIVVQCDVSDVVDIGTETVTSLESLNKVVTDMGIAISKALSSIAGSVQNVETNTDMMADTLLNVNDTLANMPTAMQTQGDKGIFSMIGEFVGVISTFEKITSLFSNCSKIIKEYMNAAKDLTPEIGKLAALFPQTSTTIVSAIDGIKAIISAITNSFGTAASTLGVSVGALCGIIALIVAVFALIAAAVVDNFDQIKERFIAIWEEYIKPIWDRIVLFAENLRGVWDIIVLFAESLKAVWDTVIMPIIDWVYQVLEPIIMTVIYGIIDAIEVVASFVEKIVIGVIDVVDGIIQFVTGLLTGDWEKMWDGVIKIIRGALETIWGFFTVMINGCAWVINTVISAIYSLIAGIVNAVGGVLSSVGKWFGLDWGGWHMEPMNEPFIPYLAQGAVLPANKPFLAMVGDQRHGTNVEAPLATIQEAVALVMEDQFNGMMAGFEAVTARQEQILETLMGIEIGDTTIGQAAMRYNRKMAIIKGGT